MLKILNHSQSKFGYKYFKHPIILPHYYRFALDVIDKATFDDVSMVASSVFKKLLDPQEYMRAIVVPSKDFTDMRIEKPEYDYTSIEALGFDNIDFGK